MAMLNQQATPFTYTKHLTIRQRHETTHNQAIATSLIPFPRYSRLRFVQWTQVWSPFKSHHILKEQYVKHLGTRKLQWSKQKLLKNVTVY